MMQALIIGSGPASAGVALALSRIPDVEITILDIGLELEPDLQASVASLSSRDQAEWPERDLQAISRHAVRSTSKGLPEKRTYGSDFPFRDVGQLDGISASEQASRSLISAAYGGFSNIWGSQVMPITAATMNAWQMDNSELAPHYKAVLDQIPFTAVNDDLAPMFPFFGSPAPLPEASQRTERALAAYSRHKKRLNRMGITMGRARLAMDAPNCIRCGMCMTGCPYSLIFSASQVMDGLRRRSRVTYRPGLLAVRLAEETGSAVAYARDMATGQVHRFEADRIFVACGAVGTTRLVANSLNLFDQDIQMQESQQFTIPMLSLHRTADPRKERQFTLNQFNMVLDLDRNGLDVAQLHFYTYDPAFIDAMPGVLRSKAAQPLMLQVLRRLSVAIGYLPSWASPRLQLRLRPAPRDDGLPAMHVTRADPRWSRNAMFRSVLTKVAQSSPLLDMYPVLPRMLIAAGGKSYHWGSSFPHSRKTATIASSDWVGRVGAWQRIHLVDASVFPSVPATTHTLTIMANAHRIATDALRLAE